jgi:N-acetylglucosamine malate deacetylase 1
LSNVLVIAAHPDDEVLGCGGAIARHTAYGDRVHVVIMSEGVTSRSLGDEGVSPFTVEVEINNLRDATKKAQEILRVDQVDNCGFPDNEMDKESLITITKSIESVIRAFQPDTVYTHHYGDLNIDHRLTHQAVITACRPTVDCRVREILGFEVPSSTEWQTPSPYTSFCPNVFIDVTEFWRDKMKALQAYDCEMRESPHSRSYRAVECLMRWRGETVGVEMAEAFALIRKIT